MDNQTEVGTRKKKILLIDDDEEFSGDLSFLLDGPYQFVSVLGSKEGVELLERERFDVVILDLKMPAFYAEEEELEGIEVLRIIRKGWGVRIPVIILSKLDTPETRRVCAHLKADAFFAKPPKIEPLKRKIEELIGENG